MRTMTFNTLTAIALAAVFCSVRLNAAEKTAPTDPSKPPAKESKDEEAAYTQSIEKRVADILAALELKDSEKKSKVHDLLITHYRSLRDWHDANDARLKTASESQGQEIKASLKT